MVPRTLWVVVIRWFRLVILLAGSKRARLVELTLDKLLQYTHIVSLIYRLCSVYWSEMTRRTDENLFYCDADPPAPTGNANISTTTSARHTCYCVLSIFHMVDFLSRYVFSFRFVLRSQLLLVVWTVMMLWIVSHLSRTHIFKEDVGVGILYVRSFYFADIYIAFYR